MVFKCICNKRMLLRRAMNAECYLYGSDASQIRYTVVSKWQNSSIIEFSWRECYGSYKCLDPATTFHAAAIITQNKAPTRFYPPKTEEIGWDILTWLKFPSQSILYFQGGVVQFVLLGGTSCYCFFPSQPSQAETLIHCENIRQAAVGKQIRQLIVY